MTYNVQWTERLFCAGEGEGVVVDDDDDDDPVSSPLSDYKQWTCPAPRLLLSWRHLPGSLCNPSLRKTPVFTPSCSRWYHRYGRINLPDKNKSETGAPGCWAYIPEVDWDIVLCNSGGAIWWATMGKTTSFTILQEKFETKLLFGISKCRILSRRTEEREGDSFRCLNAINGE